MFSCNGEEIKAARKDKLGCQFARELDAHCNLTALEQVAAGVSPITKAPASAPAPAPASYMVQDAAECMLELLFISGV
jgi:hypothetical protein